MKNYYEILGIEEKASQEEIKKVYRKLAVQHHPDKGGDENIFKEINEAYEILSDENKRKDYDHKRNNPYGGTQFEDLFSQFFGGNNPFGNGNPFKGRREQPVAPPKVMKMKVSPIESYLGSKKKVTFFRENGCGTCSGTGGEQNKCSSCGGMGFKIKTFGTGFMVQQIRATCENCGGKGFQLINRCSSCGGKGTKTESQEIEIKLPEGIDNGQYVKLQGFGDFNNGVYGDLILQIEVEPTDNFEKINNDLVYNLYLDYSELQNEVYIIPHPQGKLSTSAPKLFDTSKPLRLKGKGYNGGDMYVKLHVKFSRN